MTHLLQLLALILFALGIAGIFLISRASPNRNFGRDRDTRDHGLNAYSRDIGRRKS